MSTAILSNTVQQMNYWMYSGHQLSRPTEGIEFTTCRLPACYILMSASSLPMLSANHQMLWWWISVWSLSNRTVYLPACWVRTILYGGRAWIVHTSFVFWLIRQYKVTARTLAYRWHHVAAVWTAANNGTVKIYRDGLLTASLATARVAPLRAGGVLALGGEQDCLGACPTKANYQVGKHSIQNTLLANLAKRSDHCFVSKLVVRWAAFSYLPTCRCIHWDSALGTVWFGDVPVR